MSTLFRTTIGVPQGTFTFDFSQVPSKRKPVFDKILKVEEYIKAADELKELTPKTRTLAKKWGNVYGTVV